TGAILGTVKDQSGAVVPNARVTLTNEGTGLTTTTTTESNGSYIFSPVRIGTYSVSASVAGFERVEQAHLTLDIQQQLKVDLVLVPGEVTQTVEVTGAASALQTQNASVGQVVNSKTVNDLPLNGRNYIFLAQLTAGVTFGQQDTRGEDGNGRFSANGARPTQNNYILDGIDNNSWIDSRQNGKDFVVGTPIDAIAESQVQPANYSSEFGRAAGAVLNAPIKSATNESPGSAWEFLRTDNLDATDFFLNPGPHPKTEYRQNQFGF